MKNDHLKVSFKKKMHLVKKLWHVRVHLKHEFTLKLNPCINVRGVGGRVAQGKLNS
jgi:hypothetical protein